MIKAIKVDMADFRIDLIEDGVVTETIYDTSFGRPEHRTPIFDGGRVSWRDPEHRSKRYNNALMRWSVFLEKAGLDELDGCAFHEWDTWTPSHGCIHLNPDDAKSVYDWVGTDEVSASVTGPQPSTGIRTGMYAVGYPDMRPRVIKATNQRLSDIGYLATAPDENYDAETEATVGKFQTGHGLKLDGKVGRRETGPALGVTL